MSNYPKLDWSKRTTIDNESYPEDKLDRKKYAEFLTKFLSNQGFDDRREEGEQQQNYVLNLNSEWGSGKTYFLRRWANDLKEHHPVVYIDAWKQDYSEDPLMTVVSSLIKQLREQAGKPEDDPKFQAPRKLIGLLKAAAPALARGLAKRYIGIDPTMIMEAENEDESLGVDTTDESGNSIDMGIAAAEITKHLIKEHDAKSHAIDSLKVNVKEWVDAVIGLRERSLPAFVFIDELDRCRPDYAVEMLETIKHIFDIKGVVFVVATDTEQLQHAVKAVYGEGFNARVYLSRFFNSRFSLRAPNFNNLLEVHCDTEKLSGNYLEKLDITVWPENVEAQLMIDNITAVLNSFNLSTRTAIQLTERIIAILEHLPKGSKIDVLMITALLCIREKDDGLYTEIISGKFERNKEDKQITLHEFLDREFSLKGGGIKVYFNPKETVNLLAYDNFSNYPNEYDEGEYTADLSHYFNNIFSPYFGDFSTTRGFVYVRNNRDKATPVQQLGKKLHQFFHDNETHTDNDIGNTWLEYLYLHENLDDKPSSYYQDLVELASALDWIDDE